MSGLEASGLTVRIGARTLVDDAHLVAPRGQVTGIIGPNGAGKSTLLRAVAGVLPHDGRVRLDDAPLPRPGSRARARLIGYLPQRHEAHWPVTVRHTVELGRLPHQGLFEGLSHRDRTIVDDAMDRTDSGGFAEAPVTTLSGGERARAMLARVLAGQTPVLLVDEPVAALDPGQQVSVMALLRAEATVHDRIVVVVLHDLSLAARICDQLLLIDRGRIVQAGPASVVLESPDLEAVYGVPFGRGRVCDVPVVTPLNGRDPSDAGSAHPDRQGLRSISL